MTPQKPKQQSVRPTLNIDNFPEDLRHLLRVHAAIAEVTIRQAVIEAVEMWVKAHQDDNVGRLPDNRHKAS